MSNHPGPESRQAAESPSESRMQTELAKFSDFSGDISCNRQPHQRTFMELEASTLECVGPRDASDANGAGTISVMNV